MFEGLDKKPEKSVRQGLLSGTEESLKKALYKKKETGEDLGAEEKEILANILKKEEVAYASEVGRFLPARRRDKMDTLKRLAEKEKRSAVEELAYRELLVEAEEKARPMLEDEIKELSEKKSLTDEERRIHKLDILLVGEMIKRQQEVKGKKVVPVERIMMPKTREKQVPSSEGGLLPPDEQAEYNDLTRERAWVGEANMSPARRKRYYELSREVKVERLLGE